MFFLCFSTMRFLNSLKPDKISSSFLLFIFSNTEEYFGFFLKFICYNFPPYKKYSDLDFHNVFERIFYMFFKFFKKKISYIFKKSLILSDQQLLKIRRTIWVQNNKRIV